MLSFCSNIFWPCFRHFGVAYPVYVQCNMSGLLRRTTGTDKHDFSGSHFGYSKALVGWAFDDHRTVEAQQSRTSGYRDGTLRHLSYCSRKHDPKNANASHWTDVVAFRKPSHAELIHFIAGLGAASGNCAISQLKPTHLCRFVSHIERVGKGKSGSPKAPIATAVMPGRRSACQYRLVPQLGQNSVRSFLFSRAVLT